MIRPGGNTLAIVVTSIAAVMVMSRLATSERFGAAVATEVTVTPNETARRVDVSIGGRPFTSYVWPERLKKPVLYPLRSATGALVRRGWPFDPRPGERVDHPHHVGLWFDWRR
jgi:hypothetical protein